MDGMKAAEPEDQKVEQDGFNMEFGIDVKEWKARINACEQNKFKAHATMFQCCNSAMQTRIEETSDFSAKTRDDPFELLKTVKTRMHGQVRAECEFTQPTDTLIQFLTLKQDHSESLSDCGKRFSQSRDNLKGILGDEFMNSCVETTDRHKKGDSDKQEKQVKNSFETWCAHMHSKNSNGNECSTLKKNLQTQCTLGDDQHPAAVSRVTDASTNHSWDNTCKTADKKKKESGTKTKEKATENDDAETGTSLMQTDKEKAKEKEKKLKTIACHCCGKKGHFSLGCTEQEETEKADWHASKENAETGETANWSGFQSETQLFQHGMNLHQRSSSVAAPTHVTDFENDLILDTGVTMSSVQNKSLLAGVHAASKPMQMCTNTGKRAMEKCGVMGQMKILLRTH